MPRAPPQPSAGLGIEDELSFGSDEDLIADVGEIPLPTAIPPLPPVPTSRAAPPLAARAEKTKSGRFGSGFKGLGSSSKKEKEKDDGRRKRTATEETVKLASPSSVSVYPSAGTRSKKDSKQLAKSSLIIEPQLESVLDLASMGSPSAYSGSGSGSGSTPSIGSVPTPAGTVGKKKGLMGAFRGLGIGGGGGGGGGGHGKKDDVIAVYGGSGSGGRRVEKIRQEDALHPVKSIDSYGTRSSISRQHSIDLSQSNFSSPRTDSSNQSVHHHHLAPISMSPFQPQPPDLTPDSTIRSSIASQQTSISSLHRRASIATSVGTGHGIGPAESPSLFNKGILGKFPDIPFDAHTPVAHIADPKPRPSIVSIATDSSGVAAEPISIAFADITSVLLPTFPASLASLDSIQILSATVIRRTFTTSGMPDKEKSSSIRSLAGMLPSGASNSSAIPNTPKKPLWITQQLVLTSFKVGGSSPSATPDLAGYPTSNSSAIRESSNSRTIAHLHLFTVHGSGPGGKSSTGSGNIGLGISSSQSFGQRPRGGSLMASGGADENEVARKMIKGESTAGVWDELDGKRKFVMRVGFGGQEAKGEDDMEWVVEMRNAEQLHEWIRQIKSIAVVIRAEQEGHGRAIREAYNQGSMRGDDLALELDMQRRSASIRSPTSTSSHSGSALPSRSIYPHQYHESAPLLEQSEESDERGRPSKFERLPSAAREESPDMLGPEDDGRSRQTKPGPIPYNNTSSTRTTTPPIAGLNGRTQPASPVIDTTSLASAASSRPGTSSSVATNPVPPGGASISRSGGSIVRRKPSWSSSTSGASSVLVRKYGKAMPPPPPPPSGAPPSAPLPALPTNTRSESPTTTSNPPILPRTFELGAPVSEGTSDLPPLPATSAPRNSLPSPDITDDELALLRARQVSRAASLPTDDPSLGKAAAAKLRKERLLASFRPIPLAPEVETSPKLVGTGEDKLSSTASVSPTSHDSHQAFATSPLGAHVERMAIATPTTTVPGLSRLESTTSSATGFYTPTEGSISQFGIEDANGIRDGGEKEIIDESGLSTPSTLHLGLGDTSSSVVEKMQETYRPEPRRFASDAVSLISVTSSLGSSRASTTASRRRRERKIAVDVMSEFNETPGAAFDVEGEEEIKEDRPRAIRFA
ncbi:hypothetical protein IAR55_002051 [Kwoniella newhampshirensis]|uniref:PH domain-containing protein n=1 Tax=Kwoniella newhampshirensis TaxID=1651941 RepID=A0AAW0YQ33_9TREE